MKAIIYLCKIVLCTLSLTGGTLLGSGLAGTLRLSSPQLPPAVDLRLLGLLSLLGGMALTAGLAEISRRLSGGFLCRWLSVAWFTYAGMGLANTLESAVFTRVGGSGWLMISWLPASLLAAGVVAWMFQGATPKPESEAVLSAGFGGRTLQSWLLRLFAAWLVFPAVYVCFGIPAGLAVGNAYRAEAFGLRLPGPAVILGIQLVRGLLVLLGALPLLRVWQASRRSFWLAYAWGLFAVLGLYGLIQAYWLPAGMRTVHTAEILLDALVYSWLLTKLLLSREPALVAIEPAGSVGHDAAPNLSP